MKYLVIDDGLSILNNIISWEILKNLTGKDLTILLQYRKNKYIHILYKKNRVYLYDDVFIENCIYKKNKIKYKCVYVDNLNNGILMSRINSINFKSDKSISLDWEIIL